MKTFIKLVTVIFCINIMAACGNDSGGGSSSSPEEKAPYSMALKNKKSLPDCSDKNQNQLVYVTDEKVFYNCNGETWKRIDIVSEQKSNETQNGYGMFWVDPDTDVTWHIDDSQINLGSSDNTCERTQFSQPTTDEIKDALENGLLKNTHVKISTGRNLYVYSDEPATEYDGQTHAYLRSGAFRVCKVAD